MRLVETVPHATKTIYSISFPTLFQTNGLLVLLASILVYYSLIFFLLKVYLTVIKHKNNHSNLREGILRIISLISGITSIIALFLLFNLALNKNYRYSDFDEYYAAALISSLPWLGYHIISWIIAGFKNESYDNN